MSSYTRQKRGAASRCMQVAAAILISAAAIATFGCQPKKEKVLEIKTPNTEIEVEKSNDGVPNRGA